MLTEERALRAYATMMNTFDLSVLEPLLADDFHYASQWVFAEIETKSDYLEYIVPKLEAIRKSESRVWAELGHLDHTCPGPCVVLAQGNKDELVATVLLRVRDDKIARIDMCAVPPPDSAKRSGIYPPEESLKP